MSLQQTWHKKHVDIFVFYRHVLAICRWYEHDAYGVTSLLLVSWTMLTVETGIGQHLDLQDLAVVTFMLR